MTTAVRWEEEYFDEETDVEAAMLVGEMDEPMCRVCGCTELDACPGGCVWASEDLCSACARGGET